jgi:hypothetical protein
LLDNSGYFARFGKPSGFMLGEYVIPVDNNIEYAAASRNKVCLYPDSFVQFFRQTGSFRPVISLLTVVDIYFHFSASCL